jgi:hypothetical protein
MDSRKITKKIRKPASPCPDSQTTPTTRSAHMTVSPIKYHPAEP